MSRDQNELEDILVNGLSHVLRRTAEVSDGDRLAIAQEYKEWINCVTASDFSKQELLVIDKYTFK